MYFVAYLIYSSVYVHIYIYIKLLYIVYGRIAAFCKLITLSYTEVVSELLKHSADVNAQAENGYTALLQRGNELGLPTAPSG